jgi:hypothetical protein
VERDLMVEIVEGLGGTAGALARSESFIPVDTEALNPDTRAMPEGWCAEHRLDAVISADGGADRPLVQYTIDQARAAGIKEFIFVTVRGKSLLENCFDKRPYLENELKSKGKDKRLEYPS